MVGRLRPHSPLSVVLACVFACFACDEGSGPPADEFDSDLPGFEASVLAWQLSWAEDAGVEGDVWTTTTDLGYELRIQGAWVGNWGATLIPCVDPSEGGDARSLEHEFGVASRGQIAEGHGSGEDDPSAIVVDRVESLIAQTSVEIEGRELDSPTRYCEAHFVLAGVSSFSSGYDEGEAELAALETDLGIEAELEGASLLIVGEWRAPGTSEFEPFMLRSEQAYGRFVEIVAGESGTEATADGVSTFSLERGVEGLFDGLELSTLAPEDAAWAVLRQFAEAASISHS